MVEHQQLEQELAQLVLPAKERLPAQVKALVLLLMKMVALHKPADQDKELPLQKSAVVQLAVELVLVKLVLERMEEHQQVAPEQVQQALSVRAQLPAQAKELAKLTILMEPAVVRVAVKRHLLELGLQQVLEQDLVVPLLMQERLLQGLPRSLALELALQALWEQDSHLESDREVETLLIQMVIL